jgi:hypothetical protein
MKLDKEYLPVSNRNLKQKKKQYKLIIDDAVKDIVNSGILILFRKFIIYEMVLL